jgi:hypothetical protein
MADETIVEPVVEKIIKKVKNGNAGDFSFCDYRGELGRYQKLGEMIDLIPQFKEYYYQRRLTGIKTPTIKILREFQETIKPLFFVPYPAQYRMWRGKWDVEIAERIAFSSKELQIKRDMNSAIQLHNEEGAKIVPDEQTLEDGSKTLAGALINDATNMLREDQALEEIYTADELINRRKYVLNVMAYVTKLVHGKKALDLKANADKRESANFMMELLRKAKSGKMTAGDLSMLKDSIIPNKPQEVEVVSTQ